LNSVFEMINSILLSLIWLIPLILLLRYVKLFRPHSITPWAMPLGLVLKFFAGLFFLYVYTYFYNWGELGQDASSYMKESKMLRDVFYISPKVYFMLLTGIGETRELILEYLPHTSYWTPGSTTVINDAKNVVRVNSVIQFFSNNNPVVHLIVLSFFSLIGIKEIFTAFEEKVSIKPILFFLGVVLSPSVLFWTSSILKEPLMIMGLGLFVNGLLIKNKPIFRIPKLMFGFILLFNFKSYVLACLLFGVLYYMISKVVFIKKPIYSFFAYASLLLIILVIFPTQRTSVVQFISKRQFDFNNVGMGGIYVRDYETKEMYCIFPENYDKLIFNERNITLSESCEVYKLEFGENVPVRKMILHPKEEGWKFALKSVGSDSYIGSTYINSSFVRLVKNIPEALINSLIRPYPNDPGSNLKYLATLETWVLILIAIYALFNRKKLNLDDRKIVISMLIFIVITSLLVGWTVNILGTIVRYRIPVYLAITVLLFIVINPPLKWKKTDQLS
jgi:hypothetical protein